MQIKNDGYIILANRVHIVWVITECFNTAVRLSETLNNAILSGYYSNYCQNQFIGLLKIVHQEKYLGDFSPNHNKISKLREDGQFVY